MNEKEMLEYFDCGWSGNDYHPPCDIKECSEYRNGKCLKSRSAIRALIIRLADQFNIHCSGVGLSADDFEEIRRRILATLKPIPREFVEKWETTIYMIFHEKRASALKGALVDMLRELGHEIERVKEATDE